MLKESEYVNALVTNLDKRFSKALPILTSMEVFTPLRMCHRDSSEFIDYGKAEIGILAQHYFPCDSDREQLTNEYVTFKYHMLKLKDSLPEKSPGTCSICSQHSIATTIYLPTFVSNDGASC